MNFEAARRQMQKSFPGLVPDRGGQLRFREPVADRDVEIAAGERKQILVPIAGERVGERPDRVEPRARERREKMYPRLQVPRREARRRLMKAG